MQLNSPAALTGWQFLPLQRNSTITENVVKYMYVDFMIDKKVISGYGRKSLMIMYTKNCFLCEKSNVLVTKYILNII